MADWIVPAALYWMFAAMAMDVMIGRDLGKDLRIALWFVWPLILPFIGIVYLVWLVNQS